MPVCILQLLFCVQLFWREQGMVTLGAWLPSVRTLLAVDRRLREGLGGKVLQSRACARE